jgi:hypothetical protein
MALRVFVGLVGQLDSTDDGENYADNILPRPVVKSLPGSFPE